MRGGAVSARVTPLSGFALHQAAGHERAALTTRPHRGSASREDALRGKIILPACSSRGETALDCGSLRDEIYEFRSTSLAVTAGPLFRSASHNRLGSTRRSEDRERQEVLR